MYHFIEIIYPNCGQRFVWLEHTYKGSIYTVYKRIGHDEILESTLCPKCNIEMAVWKESCSGIDIRDKSIEVAGILRGI